MPKRAPPTRSQGLVASFLSSHHPSSVPSATDPASCQLASMYGCAFRYEVTTSSPPPPGRWIVHRAPWGNWGAPIFLGSLVVGLVGIMRAMRNAQPVAPVRPQFAKAMLGLSWLAALLCTIGDLVF